MAHLFTPAHKLAGAYLATMVLGFAISASSFAQSNEQFDQGVSQAQSAIAKRDWASAERTLQPLAAAQPNNPFVHYELAQVYENTNRTDAAKQIYQAIANLPDAAQRQYTMVVRSPSTSYMTSLVSLAQVRLNSLNAAVRTVSAPVVATRAVEPTLTPAPKAPALSASATEATSALQNWARSWANKDLNGYYGSYVDGFKGDKSSAAAWKKARASYINSKKTISLDIDNIQATVINADKVQTSFVQNYTSNAYKDVVNKTLIWSKQGNRWLIERETTK